MSEKRRVGLKCRCGQFITRSDVMRQEPYSRQGGPNYVYIKFRCSGCKKLGEHFVKEDEWHAGLIFGSNKLPGR